MRTATEYAQRTVADMQWSSGIVSKRGHRRGITSLLLHVHHLFETDSAKEVVQ